MSQFYRTSVQRQSVVTTTNSRILVVCTRLYDIMSCTGHKGLQCLDCSAHQRLELQVEFCLFLLKTIKSSLLPFNGAPKDVLKCTNLIYLYSENKHEGNPFIQFSMLLVLNNQEHTSIISKF